MPFSDSDRESITKRSPASKRRRFDDDDATFAKRYRRAEETTELDSWDIEALDGGDRWSTWDQSTPTQKGPEPRPDWLITELAAVDTELGMLKTGKEADVHLIERGVPGTDRHCLIAAKRYRGHQHRLFHRDAGYLEGRTVRKSRDSRAMAKRTAVGMEMIGAQWANAEFGALCRMYELGVPVPYPIQILGTEILEEFIGDWSTHRAAPRLAAVPERGDELRDLWRQLTEAVRLMARAGYAHGDLSAYNLLVHEGRLVIIDLPQIVDVVSNPQGREFLSRDAHNVAAWFVQRGLDVDGEELTRELIAEANIR